MLRIFLSVLVILLSACDTIRYRPTELSDKESVINTKRELILKCFGKSEGNYKFSFIIRKAKRPLFAIAPPVGTLLSIDSVSSSEKGTESCIAEQLRELQIPILSLVTEEEITALWDYERWKVQPDKQYYR